MDERLEKALEHSNYTVTLSNQLRLLSEQHAEQIIYYHGGGQFCATEQRITFVNMLVDRGITDTVLIDDNNTPIEIEDTDKFLTEIMDLYFSASNDYLAGYNEIRKNRSAKGIVEL